MPTQLHYSSHKNMKLHPPLSPPSSCPFSLYFACLCINVPMLEDWNRNITLLPSSACSLVAFSACLASLNVQMNQCVSHGLRRVCATKEELLHFNLFLLHCSVSLQLSSSSLHRSKLRRHPSSLLIGVLPDMVRCNYWCLILSGNAVH